MLAPPTLDDEEEDRDDDVELFISDELSDAQPGQPYRAAADVAPPRPLDAAK